MCALLAFIASSIAYIFHPEWAQNKVYLVLTSLSIFWGLTVINLKGIRVSAILNNVFALVGIVIPLLTLITLGLLWVVRGHTLQVDLNRSLPNLTNSTSWIALIAMIASFLGMELSSVHVNEQRNHVTDVAQDAVC